MRFLPARVLTLEGGQLALVAPTVGFFTPRVAPGNELQPGQTIGELMMLGVRFDVIVPDGVEGMVVERHEQDAIDYQAKLAIVSAYDTARAAAVGGVDTARAGRVLFCAPMSGRFYRHPAPGEPAFVREGDEVTTGTTIGLLEVMKTFNRLEYGGADVPPRARIARIVPADGSDLLRGDPILELERDG